MKHSSLREQFINLLTGPLVAIHHFSEKEFLFMFNNEPVKNCMLLEKWRNCLVSTRLSMLKL